MATADVLLQVRWSLIVQTAQLLKAFLLIQIWTCSTALPIYQFTQAVFFLNGMEIFVSFEIQKMRNI